jgi:hypothetical protein
MDLIFAEKQNNDSKIISELTIEHNWNDIVNVKYIPTGEMQKRLISQISLYDDLIEHQGNFYHIVHTLSKEKF